MITQKIDNEEEFLDPNVNYSVLMNQIKNRIQTLELDYQSVKDPYIKGIIKKEIISLRKEFFDYLKVDFDLQHTIRSNPNIYGGNNNEDI